MEKTQSVIHIQIEGKPGNRDYGFAFDLPLDYIPGVTEEYINDVSAGDTTSLASTRAYTKGTLVLLDDEHLAFSPHTSNVMFSKYAVVFPTPEEYESVFDYMKQNAQ